MTESATNQRGRFDGPAGLAALVLAVVVAAAVVERLSRPPRGEAMAAVPMPPLRVEGWLNTGGGPDPSVDSLRGKWVVVDVWATWCRPCIASMPKLASCYRDWRAKGVEIVGITSEPGADLAAIQGAIDRVEGWEWPVGYGADMLIGQLGVMELPTYVLFDPEGRSVWRGNFLHDLEAALRGYGI